MSQTEEQRLGEPDAPRKPLAEAKVISGKDVEQANNRYPWQMYSVEERMGHKMKRKCEVCGKEFLLAGMKRHMAVHNRDDSDSSDS